jgi:hypothetical protein
MESGFATRLSHPPEAIPNMESEPERSGDSQRQFATRCLQWDGFLIFDARG